MTKTGYLGRSRKVEENNIGHVVRKDDGDPVTSAPLFFVSKQVEYTATSVSVLVSVQYIHNSLYHRALFASIGLNARTGNHSGGS